MKKSLIILYAFFLTLSFLAAQESNISYAPTADENALLWQITGNDLKDTSYLFGTIHMIDKEDFILTNRTKAAINQSQKVVFEINMEEMTDITAQFALLSKAFMNDNKTLKDLVSEEEYKMIQAHFSDIGVPLFFFERVKPMFLTVVADMDMSAGGGFQSGDIVSYEMEIMSIAQAQNKPMAGLETAEFQMSMFDSIPYEAQAKMLVETIKSGNEGNEQFDKMVELYLNEDLIGMGEMIGNDEEGIGGFEDLLLTLRNKNWIPVMGEMMREQPTFFAVGAGHLGGKNGVVGLLREAGYKLVPLKRVKQ